MKNNLHPNKSRGFTLIELLIVISIIGILAAVLIAVINPAKQQAKARDAGVTATLNKIVLSINAFNSAYSRYPTCKELLDDLLNASANFQCTAALPNTGTFSITNINLSTNKCGVNGNGTGTAQCRFVYNNTGCLSANSWGVEGANGFFKWTPTTPLITLGASCAP